MAKVRAQQGPKITVGPEERAQIKALREAKGWIQKDLATRVGVTPATISNLETGRHPQVYLAVYQKIIAALRGDGAAQKAMDAYHRIVEGSAELTESEQLTVAAWIDTLRKAKTQK
jgi:transcriptional regulator with XRE-family HTH domain